MNPSPEKTDTIKKPVFAGAWPVFALLLSINLFNYVDRQVLYAVFPLLKTDLKLSDTALGFLGSSFMLVYMFCAPAIGYLADSGRRPFWLGAGTILWSMATALAGIVKNYTQLLFARSAVGIGEAAYTTVAPSYLAEYFSPEMRGRIMGFFSAATPVGSAIGYIAGGLIAQHFGWRAAFYAVGIPGLLLGIAALKLPDSRLSSASAQPPRLSDYLQLLKNRVFLFTSLSAAAATFTLGGLAAWMPTYFTRYFGYTVGQAGLAFGALTVTAGLLGSLFGGYAADWLLKRSKDAYFTVSACGFCISIPFGLAALHAQCPQSALVFFFIAETAVFAYSGPLNAAIIACSPENRRSMAFAAFVFIMHALGDAFSPTAIGALSDMFSLKTAVSACIGVLGFAALFSLLAAAANRGKN
ncbi:MAG: MFS transporter [Elusimicrobia bacterium]|nr:MFS transporter [Elusimicrobiota bacterium]